MAVFGMNVACEERTAKVGNVIIGRHKIDLASVDNTCALYSGGTRFEYWSGH
jgi:hypothetical protein